MATTATALIQGGGIKEPGWCDRNGIEHAWQSGPTLTCNPPIQTRVCVNCGKRQQLSSPAWHDDN